MKALKWIDANLERYILFLLTTIMVVVVFIQVFMRYVLSNSLSWSEELARYCFIWLIYIGISYAVKHRKHIKVDVVLLFVKERGQLVFATISNVLFLIFCVYVAIFGYGIANQLLMFGQTTPALQIPTGIVYLAAPVGMGLAAIRLLQNIIEDFINYKNKKFDPVLTADGEAVADAQPEQVKKGV